MKKVNIFLVFLLLCLNHFSYATQRSYEVTEYGDVGRISLTFRHTLPGEMAPCEFQLASILSEDIPALVDIRRSKGVYPLYGNHQCPSEEQVKSAFDNTFLPRVEQSDSLFPFVLKKRIEMPGDVPQKSYEIIGWFNTGSGYSNNDRMYGYYIKSDHQNNGIGGITIRVLTDFVMKFHENASGILTVKPHETDEEQTVRIGRTKFSGVLCSTCDHDNARSWKILINAGFQEVAVEEVEKCGWTQEVGDKKYLQLTWR